MGARSTLDWSQFNNIFLLCQSIVSSLASAALYPVSSHSTPSIRTFAARLFGCWWAVSVHSFHLYANELKQLARKASCALSADQAVSHQELTTIVSA